MTQQPLLTHRQVDELRVALAGFTVDRMAELLGPIGTAAHERGDLDGVSRALPVDGPDADVMRIFLLGDAVDERAARAALHPLDPAAAVEVFATGSGRTRARVEIRPHADETHDWLVVSDFGSDVRPGPLAEQHVLGIGAASLTLAQAVQRRDVARALDVGTGCGVQSLYLSGHARSVLATDVSERALAFAATTAALSGLSWELRAGSLLEPAGRQLFDLIVANPPFVVSPGMGRGTGGYDYRDSGFVGDGVSAHLIRSLPARLGPGGSATLLANWIIEGDGDWAGRVGSWLAGQGCDAWVWQREVVDPGSYVAMWLRDAGEQAGTPRWHERYHRWVDWFAANGVAAVGMGLVTLWNADGAAPVVVCEDVPQAVEQPAGAHLAGWLDRQRWLAHTGASDLLTARLSVAPGLVRTRHDLLGPRGWATELSMLRQSYGMRWELEVDDAIASLVAACDGTTPLQVALELLAVSTARPMAEVAAAVTPVIRDLIARGVLEPHAGRAAPR